MICPVLLGIMLLFTPIFNIKNIRVEGAEYYNLEEIRLASGIAPGENGFRKIRFSPEAILGLRLLDAELAIEALPRIKEARVFIIFPNEVGISVTERNPSVYLSYLGNYLTVDPEGYVLEVNQNSLQQALRNCVVLNSPGTQWGNSLKQMISSMYGLQTILSGRSENPMRIPISNYGPWWTG